MEKKWPSLLFVTGIDTDAGKSYATGWLAKQMAEDGLNPVTLKFIQTGNKEFSEDIQLHRKIMGTGILPADTLHLTAPIIMSYPASPELAARIDGVEIDLRLVDESAATLASQYDTVLIEGAGGLMVPIKGEYLTIDYIRERRLPAVLVTNGRLGSINHTLLSLRAIKDAGIELFAVVYNGFFDNDKIIAEDTRNYIKKWLGHHFPDTLYLEMPKL